MKTREKNRVIFAIMAIGVVMILLVMITAYAAELRHENNQLLTKNSEISGEAETLSAEIKSSGSISHIEGAATKKYGMEYPVSGETIRISKNYKAPENFAARLRKLAYK
jgi:cell division protein FtsL